jgi:hypothetical protein
MTEIPGRSWGACGDGTPGGARGGKTIWNLFQRMKEFDWPRNTRLRNSKESENGVP